MKKTTLFIAVFLFALLQTNDLKAQHTFTADLELIFRDTTRYFILGPGDSLDLGFAVVNHGPDNIDTSNYVLYSMTTIPPNYFLIVQTDDGLPLISSGDTIDSKGIRFSHHDNNQEDVTESYCYFLRTREDADSFIYDPNLTNDTICFHIVYKANPTSSIAGIAQNSNLKILPNPATGVVNIPIDDMQNQGLLRVFSIDGRLMHEEHIRNNKQKNLQLNVVNWPKGMYMADLQSEKIKRTGRFVVQ